jgi:ribonuclease HII
MQYYMNKDEIEVGLDEAGRGPLFGRVYVGAVILPQDDSFNHSLMRDSKKLNTRTRSIAFDYIKENAIDWVIHYKDEKYIDEYNIHVSNYTAMHEAVTKLLIKPDHILVDGNYFKPCMYDDDYISYTTVVKGDNKYTSIAAASILAKVGRDNYIEELCDKHPLLDEYYGIKSNKGYGAERHIEGIKTHGISPWHRKSFGICKITEVNTIFE